LLRMHIPITRVPDPRRRLHAHIQECSRGRIGQQGPQRGGRREQRPVGAKEIVVHGRCTVEKKSDFC